MSKTMICCIPLQLIFKGKAYLFQKDHIVNTFGARIHQRVPTSQCQYFTCKLFFNIVALLGWLKTQIKFI